MKVVDMHCDTVLRIYDEGGSLLENDFNIDLKKMLKGDYLLQNFAMFVNLNDSVAPRSPWRWLPGDILLR